MIVKDLSKCFNPVPKNKKLITEKAQEELKKITKKSINKKSKKLAKLEKERFSILTTNLEKCYFCSNKKMELHEVFGGRNRQKSMKWGLVVPICRKCHTKITNDKEFSKVLETKAKNVYVKKYGKEQFIKEFK